MTIIVFTTRSGLQDDLKVGLVQHVRELPGIRETGPVKPGALGEMASRYFYAKLHPQVHGYAEDLARVIAQLPGIESSTAVAPTPPPPPPPPPQPASGVRPQSVRVGQRYWMEVADPLRLFEGTKLTEVEIEAVQADMDTYWVIWRGGGQQGIMDLGSFCETATAARG